MSFLRVSHGLPRGKHCSRKCSPPTFGEDCQSVCQCPNVECHFVSGCYKRPEKNTETGMGFFFLV